MRRCHTNCALEFVCDGNECAFLPLTVSLLSAVHPPNACHAADNILTIATARISHGNSGRENILAALVDVTMGIQFRNGCIQRQTRRLIDPRASRGLPGSML